MTADSILTERMCLLLTDRRHSATDNIIRQLRNVCTTFFVLNLPLNIQRSFCDSCITSAVLNYFKSLREYKMAAPLANTDLLLLL